MRRTLRRDMLDTITFNEVPGLTGVINSKSSERVSIGLYIRLTRELLAETQHINLGSFLYKPVSEGIYGRIP